jgi:TPR repeat protein
MFGKRLLVAILAVGLAAPLGAQTVKAGVDAWMKGDYAAAVALWRPLAEKGDAEAQFNLAQAYRLGRGVPINLAAAQTWYERAAESGHPNAQTMLGAMLFENGNRTGGLRWLKRAAESGEASGLLMYGTALFNGDGVPQDPILGYAYVSRAAAKGLPAARDTLAQMDRILPLEDRKKGLAIAMAKAKAGAAPANAAPSRPAQSAAGAPTPKPAPARPASGAWRIQLGAFSQRASAEALYRKLSSTPALAGRQPFYIPAGAVTRLQVGPFETKAAAAAACAAVKQACFPVPGK